MTGRKVLVTVLATIAAEIVIAVIAGLVVVYSGAYSVAATRPHGAIVAGVLDTTMTVSVMSQSRGIKAPAVESTAQLMVGYEHYNAMCATCHGAPGIEMSEIGTGLYPSPPDLVEAAGDWTMPQLYWLIANGVKDTGMPAFRPTHTDEELWAMAAFTAQLPKMTPDEFAKFANQGMPGM